MGQKSVVAIERWLYTYVFLELELQLCMEVAVIRRWLHALTVTTIHRLDYINFAKFS